MNEIKVLRVRLDQLGISPNQLCLAVALIVMGLLTYYVAPIAFLNNNMYLFMLVMNFVLIFMILGLSFAAQILLPYVELWILSGLIGTFYRNFKKLKIIISKNLRNHQVK